MQFNEACLLEDIVCNELFLGWDGKKEKVGGGLGEEAIQQEEKGEWQMPCY